MEQEKKMTAEELEALLAKYIRHVYDCEGTDFLSSLDRELYFTKAEQAVLLRLRERE
jgi:hypothetical protein